MSKRFLQTMPSTAPHRRRKKRKNNNIKTTPRWAVGDWSKLTVNEQALLFHHHYAYDANFTIYKAGSWNSRYELPTTGSPSIHWWTRQGITTLLHEIGHHVHKFNGERETLLEEAKAWLWAEEAAMRHNLWKDGKFDYDIADYYFNLHVRHVMNNVSGVKINWRYREKQ